MIDTKTITEYNTLEYKLNNDDLHRIKLLQDAIDSNGIEFKYFLTLDYYFKMDRIDRVIEDNRHLKKVIQSFCNDEVKMFFFTEKHLKNSNSNVYGGFHRHILLEDIPEIKWKKPTSQMKKWMNELTAKEIKRYYDLSDVIYIPTRMALIHKVVKQLHHSTPNGFLGLKMLPIHNVNGLLSYCTKQNRQNVPNEYVIDTKNSSGLDDEFIRRLQSHVRYRLHLVELIQHYDLILENEDLPLNIFKTLIQEEKYSCMHKLRKIREADMVGMIMANASASAFLFTN